VWLALFVIAVAFAAAILIPAVVEWTERSSVSLRNEDDL
jgi:hypothetical protein